METFNINRFWCTLRWYVLENKNTFFKWFCGVGLAVMAIGTFFMFMLNDHPNDPGAEKIIMGEMVGFSITLLFFSTIIVNSLVFTCITRKQRRTAFLMLPATNMEKYTSACIYAAVLCPLCLILAYLVGDILRMLVFAAIGQGWHSAVKEWWEMGGRDMRENLDLVLGMIWLGSTYILGATLLRKAPFVIVSAVHLLLVFLFAYIITKFFRHSGHISINIPYYAKTVGFLLLTVVNYCVGYWLFKRFQLITSKWTNL